MKPCVIAKHGTSGPINCILLVVTVEDVNLNVIMIMIATFMSIFMAIASMADILILEVQQHIGLITHV